VTPKPAPHEWDGFDWRKLGLSPHRATAQID